MSRFWDRLKSGYMEFEKALMPEYSCLVCGRECKNTSTLICENCKTILIPITGHVCEKCGNPVPKSCLICDECKNIEWFFDQARSAYIFDDCSKKIVYDLKYYGKKFAAPHIAQKLVEPLCSFLSPQLFVPVPLHKKREKQRGFNQSKLIADALSELTSIPTNATCLQRKIETETQTGKSKEERHANIVGAFNVTNKEVIKGKNIVLIDDVFTTGATTNECARVLKKAGANKVYVLTVLKTVSAISHTNTNKRKKK